MQDPDFEKALKQLEDAVTKLESGELSLEESLRCFEDGVRSARQCRTALDSMQTRVEQLLKKSDGKIETAALHFDDENGQD
ncbi:exodeoxyribonuclease VII small subunit [Geoalkalibacter subterraneus]|jgi:exodeoxyribonuclease VII small subunit|uniref:Exodeoxyribonuclease 7 small subunit n=1 Tax=Geoalkalibacter subterraneus TaxID=483547 RepID=A0A0B5FRL9_9BACT|nr:exodeoxyribonuclease VII small subunit [Geoalkalibacter subterraneus]AJF06216.1 hypothetical protein GSUB_06145 [Geoalkalibacter subterraneus]